MPHDERSSRVQISCRDKKATCSSRSCSLADSTAISTVLSETLFNSHIRYNRTRRLASYLQLIHSHYLLKFIPASQAKPWRKMAALNIIGLIFRVISMAPMLRSMLPDKTDRGTNIRIGVGTSIKKEDSLGPFVLSAILSCFVILEIDQKNRRKHSRYSHLRRHGP